MHASGKTPHVETDILVAAEISQVMQEVFTSLGNTIVLVNEKSDPEVAAAYKDQISKIFHTIVFGVLEPLYAEHPHLKPKEWG